MAEPKPISDVAHPNKSAPSGNSKSVIVTHGAMMQDPMVNANPIKIDTSLDVKRDKSTIKPLTAPLISSTDTGKKELKVPAPEEAAETTDEAKPVPSKHVKLQLKPLPVVEGEEKVLEPEEEPKSEETATAEAPAKDITEEANNDAIDAEKVKAEAALRKLVDSKQYFLPIDTIEKRRSRRFVIFGILLSLLLILAWFDIALDASLITIDGVKPLTNLFST